MTSTKGVDDALSFANKKLTASPSLHGYTNLHRLDLSNTGLKTIDFVHHVKSTLTWLNVSGNDLSSAGAWNGIEHLTRLFVLNASNCSLTSVPAAIQSLTSLKALVLSNNQLTALSHIEHLRDLNTLVISNNALTALPSSLTTLSSLKKISAAHNKLTAAALPDLTLLAQLREVKLNDNRSLIALPSHAASWGKGSLTHMEFKGKRPPGLEILDLGNCGFEGWIDLQPLVGQANIVNLVLKGTQIAEEAKSTGFDDYKQKLTILLPSLRILDGQRFDAKFYDLREKRLARPTDAQEEEGEEAVVYPKGPRIGTSTQGRKEEQRAAEAEMRARSERRAEKLKEKDGVKKVKVKVAVASVADASVVAEKKEKKSKKGKSTAVVVDEADPSSKEDAKESAKLSEKSEKRVAGDGDGDQGHEELEPTTKKKKKDRHQARRLAETGSTDRHPIASTSTAPAEGSSSIIAVETLSSSAAAASATTSAAPSAKSKKRKVAAESATMAASAEAIKEPKSKKAKVEIPKSDKTMPTPGKDVKNRRKKDKGGVLSALRGDDSEQAAELAERGKAVEGKVKAVPEEIAKVDKVKTSVIGVVLVKKEAGAVKSKGIEVGDLFAKPKASSMMSWN